MPRAATPLSAASVVEAGVAIVAERGFDALTMRQIADRLGVWPTAVYHYVEDREHLAELVADAVVAHVDLDGPGDPVEWLRAIAWRMRALGLAHPGLASYLLERGPAGPAGLHLADAIAGRLAALGWEGAALALAYNWFTTWLAGSVHKTDRFQRNGGREGLTRFSETMRAADAASLPHVAAMRPVLEQMPDDVDGVFGWSLDLVLDALARPTAGPA